MAAERTVNQRIPTWIIRLQFKKACLGCRWVLKPIERSKVWERWVSVFIGEYERPDHKTQIRPLESTTEGYRG